LIASRAQLFIRRTSWTIAGEIFAGRKLMSDLSDLSDLSEMSGALEWRSIFRGLRERRSRMVENRIFKERADEAALLPLALRARRETSRGA